MEYVIATVVAIVVPLAAFVWWRYTSIARGARQRDEKILPLIDPIGEKLAAGKQPSTEEIESVANKSHARPYLYEVLKHFERLDLFPKQFTTPEAQAESKLVYWMMHPNELQDAPEVIELAEKVTRELDGAKSNFYVFRYQMSDGHWAAKDGWLLGLAGPFFENDVPYSGVAGAFSRCGDKYGEIKPEELVDWYIGMATRKSA